MWGGELVQEWDKMENRMWVKGQILGRWLVGWRDPVEWEISTPVQHYSLSQQQQHFVQQLGVASVGGWDWQLNWMTYFRKAEIDIVANFMEDIKGMVVQTNQQDCWGWVGYTQWAALTKCSIGTSQGKIITRCLRNYGSSNFQVKCPTLIGGWYWIGYQQRLIWGGGMWIWMTSLAHSVHLVRRMCLICFTAVIRFGLYGGKHCHG